MRRLLGTLLLLLQFGPLAGAGVCLHAAAQPKADCAMPMQGMTHDSDRSQSGPQQDCAQMVICAPASTIVPPGAVQLSGISQPSHTNYINPASLLLGDPIAPPQPPPIV